MPYKNPEKNREWQRAWYQRNKKKQAAKTKKNRQRIQTALQDYKKEQGCKECGINNPVVLVFHHRDPKEKEFTISNAARSGRSLSTLFTEAEKCDVMCANCHLILHHG